MLRTLARMVPKNWTQESFTVRINPTKSPLRLLDRTFGMSTWFESLARTSKIHRMIASQIVSSQVDELYESTWSRIVHFGHARAEKLTLFSSTPALRSPRLVSEHGNRSLVRFVKLLRPMATRRKLVKASRTLVCPASRSGLPPSSTTHGTSVSKRASTAR
jgi:hypothetical protein